MTNFFNPLDSERARGARHRRRHRHLPRHRAGAGRCRVRCGDHQPKRRAPAADRRRDPRRLACVRWPWPATCANPADVDAVVAQTVDTFGRLDILVNGAAGNFVCLAENLSPNGFGTVVDIDLKGTFNVSRAAFPFLKKQGGAVLNISATLATPRHDRAGARLGREGRHRCAHAMRSRPSGGRPACA